MVHLSYEMVLIYTLRYNFVGVIIQRYFVIKPLSHHLSMRCQGPRGSAYGPSPRVKPTGSSPRQQKEISQTSTYETAVGNPPLARSLKLSRSPQPPPSPSRATLAQIIPTDQADPSQADEEEKAPPVPIPVPEEAPPVPMSDPLSDPLLVGLDSLLARGAPTKGLTATDADLDDFDALLNQLRPMIPQSMMPPASVDRPVPPAGEGGPPQGSPAPPNHVAKQDSRASPRLRQQQQPDSWVENAAVSREPPPRDNNSE